MENITASPVNNGRIRSGQQKFLPISHRRTDPPPPSPATATLQSLPLQTGTISRLYARQLGVGGLQGGPRGDNSATTPLSIAAIVVVVVFIAVITGIIIWRIKAVNHQRAIIRRRKLKGKYRARKPKAGPAVRFIFSTHPDDYPDPLETNEAVREAYQDSCQRVVESLTPQEIIDEEQPTNGKTADGIPIPTSYYEEPDGYDGAEGATTIAEYEEFYAKAYYGLNTKDEEYLLKQSEPKQSSFINLVFDYMGVPRSSAFTIAKAEREARRTQRCILPPASELPKLFGDEFNNVKKEGEKSSDQKGGDRSDVESSAGDESMSEVSVDEHDRHTDGRKGDKEKTKTKKRFSLTASPPSVSEHVENVSTAKRDSHIPLNDNDAVIINMASNDAVITNDRKSKRQSQTLSVASKYSTGTAKSRSRSKRRHSRSRSRGSRHSRKSRKSDTPSLWEALANTKIISPVDPDVPDSNKEDPYAFASEKVRSSRSRRRKREKKQKAGAHVDPDAPSSSDSDTDTEPDPLSLGPPPAPLKVPPPRFSGGSSKWTPPAPVGTRFPVTIPFDPYDPALYPLLISMFEPLMHNQNGRGGNKPLPILDLMAGDCVWIKEWHEDGWCYGRREAGVLRMRERVKAEQDKRDAELKERIAKQNGKKKDKGKGKEGVGSSSQQNVLDAFGVKTVGNFGDASSLNRASEGSEATLVGVSVDKPYVTEGWFPQACITPLWAFKDRHVERMKDVTVKDAWKWLVKKDKGEKDALRVMDEDDDFEEWV
ncbi:hypothetical protein HDV05_007064 [Chytridiales sp. JEL 0842]|nr:hypothetical protein HDV05_007064 [Chytridiales sp. JEL 0842]